MQVVAGHAEIDDLASFLSRLDALEATHGSVIQAVDARYVAGRRHLDRAMTLTRRAIDRDATIADDAGMELLLYIAGTRQIDRALELGVDTGRQPVAIVIDGGDEPAVAAALRESIAPDEEVLTPDEDRLTTWFDITAAERAATDAPLEALVCERVALLVLDV